MKKKLLQFSMLAILTTGFAFNLHSQGDSRNADIMKIASDECIVMDGVADDYVWGQVEANPIDRNFLETTPTFNSATWKAVWSDTRLYIIIEVDDDVWVPDFIDGYEALGAEGRGDLRPWNSDKPEIYLDSSSPLDDGGSPASSASRYKTGNYQFADTWVAPESGGTYPIVGRHGATSYDTWDGEGKYVREFFVQWDSLRTDTAQAAINDPTKWGIDDPLNWEGGKGAGVFGFDISLLDLDAVDGVLQRAVWRNTAQAGENYQTFDYLGTITLKSETVACASSGIFNKQVSNLKVYPSIVKEYMDISGTDIEKVEIFAITGQIVRTEWNETHINLSDLNRGIYIVKATSGSGALSMAKIVKE